VSSIPLVTADVLNGNVVDVRQANEFSAGHVPGATNIELGAIAGIAVPAGPLTLMCGHGERAMSAASMLESRGARDLRVLLGGPDDWAKISGETLEVV
jgi:rhodanese-related sulfurtransferase